MTEDELKKFYGESMYNALTREERMKTAPRVPRFAPISTTSGRWIDAGFRPGFCMDIISWDAPVEVWRKTILQDGFFNRPVVDVTINASRGFEPPFEDEQVESVWISSPYGNESSLRYYDAWRDALLADLGPADKIEQADLSYVGLDTCERLIWESAASWALLTISQAHDIACAKFGIRRKLRESLECSRKEPVA